MQKLVNQNAKIIEKVAKNAQRGDYDAMAEYFADVCDVRITVFGNYGKFEYDSVVIQLAFGGPNIYFDIKFAIWLATSTGFLGIIPSIKSACV